MLLNFITDYRDKAPKKKNREIYYFMLLSMGTLSHFHSQSRRAGKSGAP